MHLSFFRPALLSRVCLRELRRLPLQKYEIILGGAQFSIFFEAPHVRQSLEVAVRRPDFGGVGERGCIDNRIGHGKFMLDGEAGRIRCKLRVKQDHIAFQHSVLRS